MSSMSPAEQARIQLLKKMTPATQEVAKHFEERFARSNHDIVLTFYNLGARVKDVAEKESEYGSAAIEQLADYLGIPGGKTTLYNLKNFSLAFEKDTVKAAMLRQMGNGQNLSLAHWMELIKLKDEKAQTKMLERVFSESMSAADLQAEVRSGAAGAQKNVRGGGRKPKAPTSPIIGLQKTFELGQQFNRYQEMFDKGVAAALDEIDAEKVDKGLLEKLEKTRETVAGTVETAKEMISKLDGNIKRVKKILVTKADKDEDDEDAGDEEETPKKAKKAAAEAPAKKKKKKAKKPVAA